MEKNIITDNGLPIYYYSNDHLHRFCITLYIKAGSMYEAGRYRGITHFWEHMIFRNINASLNGEMKKMIDKMGAYFNASTCKEFVEVKIIAATKHFAECADIITRTFGMAVYSEDEVDIERKRVKSEIREENEKKSLDYFTQKIIWKNTTLARSITGKSEQLDAIDKKILSSFQEETLSVNNMFFYVTGAFSDDDIKVLKEKTEQYELKFTTKLRENNAPVPSKFMKRNAKVKIKKDDYFELRFSFDFDTTRYNRAELDLLYDILFDGECSKLFEALSDNTGLIYSYDSTLEQYNNIGNIYFSFEVKGKRLLEATQIVVKTLSRLKKGIVDELDYVKAQYTDNAEMDLDEPEKLNWIMSYDGHILGENYKDIEQRVKAYESVKADRMTQIANEIFVTDNMVVTAKVEKKKIKAEQIYEVVSKL